MRTLVGEVEPCVAVAPGGSPPGAPLRHPCRTTSAPGGAEREPEAPRAYGSIAPPLDRHRPEAPPSHPPSPTPPPPRVEGRCHVSPFPRPSSQESSEHPPSAAQRLHKPLGSLGLIGTASACDGARLGLIRQVLRRRTPTITPNPSPSRHLPTTGPRRSQRRRPRARRPPSTRRRREATPCARALGPSPGPFVLTSHVLRPKGVPLSVKRPEAWRVCDLSKDALKTSGSQFKMI